MKTRRDFLKVCSGTLASLVASSLPLPEKAKGSSGAIDKRPNILFILTDDQRWDALGFKGKYPFLKTPNMDRIRYEGAHFENAFVTTSLCAPSRACFLTGVYPHIHGVSTNQEGREYDPDKTPSFAQILQQAGYETAFIGKWHMAHHNRPRKGFDYWCSFEGQGQYYGNDLNINGNLVRNEGYITDELTKYTLDFINKKRNRPFLLFLSHKALHGPFTPAERHRDLYKDELIPEPVSWRDDLSGKPAWQRNRPTDERLRRHRDCLEEKIPADIELRPWDNKTGWHIEKNYLRCLAAVDEGIGQILNLLEKKDQLDRTAIVLAGDNGFFLGEHQLGDKRLPYNEAMRIPLIMRYPKAAKAGTTIDQMVLNIDLAPTLLELAGAVVPKNMQGNSVLGLLNGLTKDWRTSFLYCYWVDLKRTIPRIIAVRTEDFTYVTCPDIDDIDEMYDLKNDPFEMVNLAENPEYAHKKKELTIELERLKAEYGYRPVVPRPLTDPDRTAKQGLLLWYNFDNIRGGKVIDYAGASLHGRVEGAEIVSGLLSNAMTFTGTESVQIPYDVTLDPSKGSFTMECVVKATGDGVILAQGNEKFGFVLFVENGKPGLAISNNRWITFIDSGQAVLNKWTHITAEIENYNNYMRLYVNGKLMASRAVLLPLQRMLPDYGGINVGRDSGGLVDPVAVSKTGFHGYIDMLRIYRQKFSVEEIEILYHSSLLKMVN